MEAIGSELNLFEPAVSQSAVVGEFVQEFKPLATIIQGSPLNFEIEGGGNNYVDLNNTKLEVRVKLTGADGAAIAGGTRVGVANLTLHSLFSSMIVKVQDKVVTDSNNLYGYRALLETLINYQSDVLKTRMLCEGFIEDTAGSMDVVTPGGANVGLGAREVTFNASTTVRLIGRPHSDLFHQDKLIPPGVKIGIQLTPTRPSFLIKTAPPARDTVQVLYKFEIVSARFLVQMKELSPSMVVAHEQMVQEANYRYPHTKVLLKTQNIPTGVTSYSIPNMFKGKLPDRIAIAMVEDAALTGHYNRNPYNFQNFGLNSVAVKANSNLVPRIELEPNFTTGDYLREYLTVLEAIGYDIGPNTWSVTPNAWANGNNIYVFKITPGSIGAVRSSQLTGDIGLHLTFAAGTPGNITLIILSEEPATLEIDKFKNVFID